MIDKLFKLRYISFFVLFGIFVFFRVYLYSPLNTSVGTNDTKSYILSSEMPFPSWDFFTTSRDPTIPLIYKILKPAEGYKLTMISEPAVPGNHGSLEEQDGFNRVVIFQLLFSILSWGALCFVMLRHLSCYWVKIGALVMICLFAFTPQMADWDQILLSESVSFSLCALLMALYIEFVFLLSHPENGKKQTWTHINLIMIILVSIALIFTRDTNAYILLITIFSLLPALIVFIIKKSRKIIPIIVLTISLAGVYIWHQVSFQASERWLLPFLNNMTGNVFPYPNRVELFTDLGMPVSSELLNLRGSAEYNGIYNFSEFISWAKVNGLTAYSNFLIHTPLWAIKSIFENLSIVFSQNLQPYFSGSPDSRQLWLILIGDMIHPLSSAVILVVIILLILIIDVAIRNRDSKSIAWLWICGWLFTCAITLLAIGYLGEIRSVIRHAMGGVVLLRLMLWLSIAILADLRNPQLE
jgi:hypothetical protein